MSPAYRPSAAPAPGSVAELRDGAQVPAPTATSDNLKAGSMVLETHSRASSPHALLTGYLWAVTARLSQRGIQTRAVRTHPSVLSATLTLVAVAGNRSPWVPTCLHWTPQQGWSASLQRGPNSEGATVTRYLHCDHVLPTPESVAHFVAALRVDPNTIWAATRPGHPRPLDERLVQMQLSGYADMTRTF